MLTFADPVRLLGAPLAGVEETRECGFLSDPRSADRDTVDQLHRLGQEDRVTDGGADPVAGDREVLAETVERDQVVLPPGTGVEVVGRLRRSPIGPVGLVEDQGDAVGHAQLEERRELAWRQGRPARVARRHQE